MKPIFFCWSFALIMSMVQAQNNCTNRLLYKVIDGKNVWKFKDTIQSVVAFRAGLAVDADGSPRAYHPDSKSGLDNLGNAGSPGNWWALVTDNGKSSGKPIIQGPKDPAPGFYVSATALFDTAFGLKNPRRYVNAETVPYFVIPSDFASDAKTKVNIRKGDIALVINTKNNKRSFAIYGDVGPRGKIGEGSIKLAQNLGINASARNGGISTKDLVFIVFENSGYRIPLTEVQVQNRGTELLQKIDLNKILTCLPQ